MAEEDPKSFVVRDRRGRVEQPDEPPGSGPAPQAEPSRPTASESAREQDPRPPVTFSSFIFSLGTSALMLMGEQLDPQQE
ncbi:MAG: hypothetical protein ACREJU_16445, partial [Nitrospiraceae bacterium]